MHFQSRTLLTAALLVALAASPAIAQGVAQGVGSYGGGGGGGGGITIGSGAARVAPGPVAGAGLGYLVLAGGYYAVRRWRKQNTGE